MGVAIVEANDQRANAAPDRPDYKLPRTAPPVRVCAARTSDATVDEVAQETAVDRPGQSQAETLPEAPVAHRRVRSHGGRARRSGRAAGHGMVAEPTPLQARRA